MSKCKTVIVVSVFLVLMLPPQVRSHPELSLKAGSVALLALLLETVWHKNSVIVFEYVSKEDSASPLKFADESLPLDLNSSCDEFSDYFQTMVEPIMMSPVAWGCCFGSPTDEDEPFLPQKGQVMCQHCRVRVARNHPTHCDGCLKKLQPESGGACAVACKICGGYQAVSLKEGKYICKECQENEIEHSGNWYTSGCMICDDDDSEDRVYLSCGHFYVHKRCMVGEGLHEQQCPSCGVRRAYQGRKAAGKKVVVVKGSLVSCMKMNDQVKLADKHLKEIQKAASRPDLTVDEVLAAFRHLPNMTKKSAKKDLVHYFSHNLDQTDE